MKFYKITATIASIFSVIFSLSIIKELEKFVHPIVLTLMSIFLILFVIYNEISKVKELQKYFKKRIHNKLAIGLTFIISILLSSIGIYFYSNNTMETEITLNNDLKQKELFIEQSYQLRVDSLKNIPISSAEYSKIVEDISFWRERKSDTKEQRQEILNNIRILESKREKLYNTLEAQRKSEYERISMLKSNKLDLLLTQNNGETQNISRNNFISIVFLIMVIVTEFIILNVQRQIAYFYTEQQIMILKIVKDCEYRNLENIDINEFKYNNFNPASNNFKKEIHTPEEWKTTKKAHNLLGELGIIEKEYTLGGKIKVNNPSEFLVKYFNKINKL